MRLQTRLRKHLEPGWVIEVPGQGVEDPLTGNLRPGPPEKHDVSVSIQQRLLTGIQETGQTGVLDERIAIILPPVEIPPDAILYSPQGDRWNAAGEGMVRRTAFRRPVYSVVSVRRAKEGDRHG